VERDLPSLVSEEQAAADELAALLAQKSLSAPAARKKLVDEITPRFVRLRRRAETLQPSTLTVRQLASEYLVVLDSWTEVCRTLLYAIDDPKVSGEAGLLAVRERMADAAQRSKHFADEIVRTCQQHRLAPPPMP
jgi:hypothetical protein